MVKRILFVCMGNICRSPAGEAILKKITDPSEIEVESCGIGNWHVGRSADQRMREASQERGFVLNGVAKQFQISFFDTFDYILAADQEVLKYLKNFAKDSLQKSKVFLMTEFSTAHSKKDVPDPYYKSNEAFEEVLDILEEACAGLLSHLKKAN